MIPKPTNQKTDWLSVAQMSLSLLAALTLWGFALILVLFVVTEIVGNPSNIAAATPILMTAAGFGCMGVLLLPSTVLAFLKLINRPIPIEFEFRYTRFLLIVFPVLVGMGYLVAKIDALMWIALPVIHVLAVCVSVLWVMLIGVRGITIGSPQRAWGVFSSGLVLAPLLSMVIELIMMLIVGVIGISYLAQDPSLASKLDQLSQSILLNPDQPPEELFSILEPYIFQPGAIYLGLIVGAFFVPLIEEFFKPIGVWLLAGKKITPAQGFSAGAISGAGFALFENFTLAASSGEEWAAVIVARVGTSLIHILTTGLTGWAIALAWREGKYIRLAATYAIAVVIHALWNGLVILSIAPEILPADSGYPAALEAIGTASPIGFGILLIGALVTYWVCNRTLRRVI